MYGKVAFFKNKNKKDFDCYCINSTIQNVHFFSFFFFLADLYIIMHHTYIYVNHCSITAKEKLQSSSLMLSKHLCQQMQSVVCGSISFDVYLCFVWILLGQHSIKQTLYEKRKKIRMCMWTLWLS